MASPKSKFHLPISIFPPHLPISILLTPQCPFLFYSKTSLSKMHRRQVAVHTQYVVFNYDVSNIVFIWFQNARLPG